MKTEVFYNGESQGVIDWERVEECPVCGKKVCKIEMWLTCDCHGIPMRYVCPDCYEKIMDEKGYDGEYYTELDECLDWDY